MRSTFFGLEIGKTGLMISQKALDVTGHNIANVNTAGYTRQRLITESIDPINSTFTLKPIEEGQVGAGVEVKILDQVRDSFLDRKFRTEQSIYSEWQTRTTGLSYVETLFDEVGDVSLRTSIIDLFNSFDDMVQNSSDKEQRTNAKQTALTLIANFQHAYDSLQDLHAGQNTAVQTVVGQVNTITANIAELNEAIYIFERDGEPANDLKDKRNLLIDELSSLIDIEYDTDEKGFFSLTTTAYPNAVLVSHDESFEMTIREDINQYSDDPLYIPQVIDPATGAAVDYNPGGGELQGHMDLRDSQDPSHPGLPYFLNQMNTLALALVQSVNEQHRAGFTHPSGGLLDADGKSVSGINFFTEPADPTTFTIDDLSLSAEIAQINGEWNIASSSVAIDITEAENARAGNNENMLLISALIDKTNIPGIDSSYNGFMTGLVLEVAKTLEHSKIMSETQYTTTLAVDNQRISISGVSLDEEMTHMIRYQHAYNGASRVITAMDECLETIISSMGLVGR